jgi:hypothetical protein
VPFTPNRRTCPRLVCGSFPQLFSTDFDAGFHFATARFQRLPQHLDYPLKPAPLGACHSSPIFPSSLTRASDLTLPLVPDKSPLPAIIVTPSSPRSTHGFSIAFVPSEKPSLRERISSFFAHAKLKVRTRVTIIFGLLFLLLLCHLLLRLMINRPYLEIQIREGGTSSRYSFVDWLDFSVVLSSTGEEKLDFMVNDM